MTLRVLKGMFGAIGVALALLLAPAVARAQATPAPAPAPAPAAAPAAEDKGSLEVTVTYKGKGEVSAKNEVSIFLFTDPNINEASMPVAVGVVEENGGHFLFTGLPPVVYIAVVYDDAGTYNRESAPPPGTPVAIYGLAAGGAAEAVKAGKDSKVSVTFDDSNRM
jgi:hypothetical protein